MSTKHLHPRLPEQEMSKYSKTDLLSPSPENDATTQTSLPSRGSNLRSPSPGCQRRDCRVRKFSTADLLSPGPDAPLAPKRQKLLDSSQKSTNSNLLDEQPYRTPVDGSERNLILPSLDSDFHSPEYTPQSPTPEGTDCQYFTANESPDPSSNWMHKFHSHYDTLGFENPYECDDITVFAAYLTKKHEWHRTKAKNPNANDDESKIEKAYKELCDEDGGDGYRFEYKRWKREKFKEKRRENPKCTPPDFVIHREEFLKHLDDTSLVFQQKNENRKKVE